MVVVVTAVVRTASCCTLTVMTLLVETSSLTNRSSLAVEVVTPVGLPIVLDQTVVVSAVFVESIVVYLYLACSETAVRVGDLATVAPLNVVVAAYYQRKPKSIKAEDCENDLIWVDQRGPLVAKRALSAAVR